MRQLVHPEGAGEGRAHAVAGRERCVGAHGVEAVRGTDVLARRAVGKQRRCRTAIDLPAHEGRHGIRAPHERRRHVRGQSFAHPGAQFGRKVACARRARARDDACAQLRGGSLAHHRACRLRHRRVLRQACLDRGELDAVAAQLDLPVHPTEVLEHAVGPLPHPVARTVEAPKRRVPDEPLGRGLGSVAVAAREPDAADPEFSLGAVGDGRAVVAHHEGIVALDRGADVHRHPRPHGAAHHGDGALGRAVAVLEPQVRAPSVRKVLRQRLAPDVEEPQVGQFPPRVLHAHGAQQRGRRAERADALRLQPGHQVRPRTHAFVVDGHQRRAHAEGKPRLLDARVVGVARALRHAVAGPEPEPRRIRPHQVRDARVLDHHALGEAGGAARVDQVGEVVRPGGARRACRRCSRGDGGRIADVGDVDHRAVPGHQAQPLGPGPVGEHRQWPCIVDHRSDVPVGEGRVDAAERESAPHGGQLARVDVDAVARQHHQHDRLFAAVACRRQRRRDPVRAGIELQVGQAGARPAVAGRHVDRHAVGMAPHRVSEDGVKRVHAHARRPSAGASSTTPRPRRARRAGWSPAQAG